MPKKITKLQVGPAPPARWFAGALASLAVFPYGDDRFPRQEEHE